MTTDAQHVPPRTTTAAAVYRDGIAGLPQAFPPAWADDVHADVERAFAAARSHPGAPSAAARTATTSPCTPSRCAASRTSPPIRPSRPCARRCWARTTRSSSWASTCRWPEPSTSRGTVTSRARPGRAPTAYSPPWRSTSRRSTSPRGRLPPRSPREPTGTTAGSSTTACSRGRRRPSATPGWASGDLSVRTGLTIHRGTANLSDQARAVLIIGVVTAELADTAVHRIAVTRTYRDRLPAVVREHLRCTVVDELRPIVQQHDIEGLVMG